MVKIKPETDQKLQPLLPSNQYNTMKIKMVLMQPPPNFLAP